jgi:hypothetical protein
MKIDGIQHANCCGVSVILGFSALASGMVPVTNSHKVGPIKRQRRVVLRVYQVMHGLAVVRALRSVFVQVLALWILRQQQRLKFVSSPVGAVQFAVDGRHY